MTGTELRTWRESALLTIEEAAMMHAISSDKWRQWEARAELSIPAPVAVGIRQVHTRRQMPVSRLARAI